MSAYQPNYDRFLSQARALVDKIAGDSLATTAVMKPPSPPKVATPPSMKPVAPPQPKANFAPKFNPVTKTTSGTSPGLASLSLK